MSWLDPNKTLFSVSLYPAGYIHFGYATYGGGMTVGTTPLMACIDVPIECGEYPRGWFRIEKSWSLLKIRNFFKEKDNMLPDWLLLDCYRYFYEKSKRV